MHFEVLFSFAGLECALLKLKYVKTGALLTLKIAGFQMTEYIDPFNQKVGKNLV